MRGGWEEWGSTLLALTNITTPAMSVAMPTRAVSALTDNAAAFIGVATPKH